MRRLFINPYKIKRRLKRRLEREDINSTRDVAWHETKVNPHYYPSHNRRRTILLAVAGGIALIATGLILFHPLFQITDIRVFGLERINRDEFLSGVNGILRDKKLFMFPGQSYPLVDTEEIQQILLMRYSLEEASVKKTFPNTLSIAVEEKIATVLYDNGKTYSTVGLDGRIVETLRQVGDNEWKERPGATPSSTERFHVPDDAAITADIGLYPILYDLQAPAHITVHDAVLTPERVEGIIGWYRRLPEAFGISMRYMTLEQNATGLAVIETGEGWEIRNRLNNDRQEQMDALQIALKQIKNRKGLQYIDVRYPGKAYWR